MNFRMYSFVLRQLSPMQKGIQTAHAVVEYSNKLGSSPAYVEWSNVDKTLIVLDGGTFQDMEEIESQLSSLGVKFATFREPDLKYLCTSITVLVDERVYDTKKYPNYDQCPQSPSSTIDGVRVVPAICILPEPYEQWVERMGGEENVKLRELIFSKRLSQ